MKKYKLMGFILLTALFNSCEADYPVVDIKPDLTFPANGLQSVNTISIYDEITQKVVITRTLGLSQEFTMDITVDETLVTEHNTIYEENYKTLASEYYTVSSQVVFAKHAKEAEIEVKLKPKAFTAAVGLVNTADYILPIRLKAASTQVNFDDTKCNALLNMNISKPLITVQVPNEDISLEFIKGIATTQTIDITAFSNFNTLNTTKVAYKVNAAKVAEYNTVNGTSCVLLPSGFTINEDIFDAENMKLTSTLTFDCSTLDESKQYLLPLELTQTDVYDIEQKSALFVTVNITSIKLSVAKGGTVVVATTGKGTLTANLNSPILDDMPIDFNFDPDKVATYNAANGTAFKTLDASKVSVTPTKIAAGSKSVNAQYVINISDLAYDSDDKYMIPLTLKTDNLVEGTTVIGDKTVYIEVVKTIVGTYTKTEIPSAFKVEKGNSMLLSPDAIYLSTDKSNLDPAKGKYAFFSFNDTASASNFYFNISDKEVAGKPGCYELSFYFATEGWDFVEDSKSYCDTSNGDLIINLRYVGWWSPGGGNGAPIAEGNEAGESIAYKLSNRQPF